MRAALVCLVVMAGCGGVEADGGGSSSSGTSGAAFPRWGVTSWCQDRRVLGRTDVTVTVTDTRDNHDTPTNILVYKAFDGASPEQDIPDTYHAPHTPFHIDIPIYGHHVATVSITTWKGGNKEVVTTDVPPFDGPVCVYN